MAWKFQNPKTGEIVAVKEQYDEKTQTDVSRETAIRKGYVPVINVVNPKSGESYLIDDRTLDKALGKGYLTEETFQGIKEIEKDRIERAARQVRSGPEGQALAALKAFSDTATFGFSDELAGAYQAAVNRGKGQTFLDAYRNYRDIDRALSEAAITEAPAAYIGGALASGIPTLGATVAKVPTLAKTIGTGALGGAVYGAGEAEEVADIPKEAVTQAGIGAGVAGVFGLLPVVSRVIKSKPAQESIKESIETVAKEAPDLEAVGEQALKARKTLDAEKELLVKADLDSFKNFKDTAPRESILKILEESDKNILDQNSPLFKQAKRTLGRLKEDITPENLLLYKAYLKTSEAAERVKTITPGKRGYRDILKQEGEEFTLNQYERALKQDAALTALTKAGLRNNLPEFSAARKLGLLFSDVRPVAKTIDMRLGTGLERVIDGMSKKHNLYTVRLGTTLKDVTRLTKATRKAGLSEEEVFKALDTGDLSNPVVKDWNQFFNKVREDAVAAGLPIEQRANYVPYRRLSPIRYQKAIENRVTQLEQQYGKRLVNLTDDEFDELSKNADFKELVREIKFLRNPPDQTGEYSNQLFSDHLASVLVNPRQNKQALAMEAFAAKRRDGDIPDFVKDKQVSNLASRWLQSTFRHISTRDGLAELNNIIQIADKAGDTFTHKYLTNLTQDIIGSRTDTLGAYASELGSKFLVYMENKADKAADPIAKKLYEGAGYLPNILNTMARQVYANYIGLNPKSVIQNMTSPLFVTVPEMGAARGTKAWLNSQVDIAKALKDGIEITLTPEFAARLGKRPGEVIKTRNLNTLMQNEGLLPRQWTGEMVDALQDSLRKNAVADMSRDAIDLYTNMMMSMFERSEIYARASTYFMGKRLARDAVSSPKMFSKLINEIESPAYKRSLTQAYESGNNNEVTKQLIEYLNAQTMFNYDRANMSAYGRYMGPLFSVFSKWPTTIAGKIIQQTSDNKLKGARRVAQVLLAPYLALSVVDYFTQPENSEQYNKIFGRGGLKSWTAADSVMPLLEGGIFESPAFQSFGALAKVIGAEDKPTAAYNWLNDFYNTFGLGSGLLRFLGEDLPILRGEAKPEGPKIERRLKELERLVD